MIDHLSGACVEVKPLSVVIDVGGVGFFVHVPVLTSAGLKVGKEVTLNTVLVVREDAMNLYGFSGTDDKEMFLLVTSVSGIGPKMALMLMSAMDTKTLATALQGDVTSLIKIKGIGGKTAESLCFKLKDKVAKFASDKPIDTPVGSNDTTETAVGALVSLGYKQQESVRMVERASKGLEADGKSEMTVEELIRAALAQT